MKKAFVSPSPVADSGVSIAYRGNETSGKTPMAAVVSTACSFVIALALSLGALLTFVTMYDIPVHTGVLCVFAGLLTLVLTPVYLLSKKTVGFVSLGLAALLLAVALLFGKATAAGFVYVRDFVYTSLCEGMLWEVPVLSYTFTAAMQTETTFVLCLLAVPLTAGISYFAVRKGWFLVPFLLTVPFFEVGAFLGCVPNALWFAALFAGRIGQFALCLASRVRKIRKRKGDKKKSSTVAAGRKRSLITSIGALLTALTFALFSLGHVLVSAAGYTYAGTLRLLRIRIQETTDSLVDYILGEDHDGSLKEGRLYAMEKRDIRNRHYMTLEMPLTEQTYLRGFVGVTYASDRWLPYNAETDSNKALEALYQKTRYYPQNTPGTLISAQLASGPLSGFSYGTVSVSKLRRKKDYVFSAYQPHFSTDFTYLGDTVTLPENKASYSYSAFLGNRPLFPVSQSRLYQDPDFAAVWEAYQTYVNETYTRLPAGLDSLKALVDELKAGKKHGYSASAASDLELADRIRTYLAGQIAYSLEAEALPENTEFVQWMLSGDKTGYSAHYATAMTVLLRLAGVPARYAEGYLVTDADYETATKNGGKYTLNITDENAHAWVELFDGNYGWITLEVTPGFYTESLLESIPLPKPPAAEPEDELKEGPDSERQEEVNDESPEETPGEDGYEEDENPPPVEYVPDDPEEDPEDVLPEKETEFEQNSAVFSPLILQILTWVAVALLILALLVGALFSQRAVRLARLNRQLTQPDRYQRVLALYRYYTRLLRFEGLENSRKLPYLRYAAYLCEHCARLQGPRHQEAMQIFLKNRFSNEPVSDEELALLEQLVQDYRSLSLIQLKGTEKFRFMFIEVLG